jgi:hypothetical protein
MNLSTSFLYFRVYKGGEDMIVKYHAAGDPPGD